jgi:hypothetical protein
LGYTILFTSVITGFFPAIFPSEKFGIIHGVFALISILAAFSFSLYFGIYLWLHPVLNPLGNLSLLTSASMTVAIAYYAHRLAKKKHRENGVLELFVVGSIIL